MHYPVGTSDDLKSAVVMNVEDHSTRSAFSMLLIGDVLHNVLTCSLETHRSSAPYRHRIMFYNGTASLWRVRKDLKLRFVSERNCSQFTYFSAVYHMYTLRSVAPSFSLAFGTGSLVPRGTLVPYSAAVNLVEGEIISKTGPVPLVELSNGELVVGPKAQGVEFGELIEEDPIISPIPFQLVESASSYPLLQLLDEVGEQDICGYYLGSWIRDPQVLGMYSDPTTYFSTVYSMYMLLSVAPSFALVFGTCSLVPRGILVPYLAAVNLVEGLRVSHLMPFYISSFERTLSPLLLETHPLTALRPIFAKGVEEPYEERNLTSRSEYSMRRQQRSILPLAPNRRFWEHRVCDSLVKALYYQWLFPEKRGKKNQENRVWKGLESPLPVLPIADGRVRTTVRSRSPVALALPSSAPTDDALPTADGRVRPTIHGEARAFPWTLFALHLDSAFSKALSFHPTTERPSKYVIKVGITKGLTSTNLLIRCVLNEKRMNGNENGRKRSENDENEADGINEADLLPEIDQPTTDVRCEWHKHWEFGLLLFEIVLIVIQLYVLGFGDVKDLEMTSPIYVDEEEKTTQVPEESTSLRLQEPLQATSVVGRKPLATREVAIQKPTTQVGFPLLATVGFRQHWAQWGQRPTAHGAALYASPSTGIHAMNSSASNRDARFPVF
ncbi:hypothetical protein M9H77_23820 [Catharanthus roseus]|uniref:Uncharacterized protein n=1 Tax=Catharanthus roseus TaxID=4058 RepID=A0ACC0AU02_CATRO|nr:hypothetical protein M9H77_23820 [Catharanthus roseus]